MAMSWLQGINKTTPINNSAAVFFRFISKFPPYAVKVGVPEFLHGIGNGVETHVPKLESEIGDIQKLLVTHTLKLKKLRIPCKHLFYGSTVLGIAEREVLLPTNHLTNLATPPIWNFEKTTCGVERTICSVKMDGLVCNLGEKVSFETDNDLFGENGWTGS